MLRRTLVTALAGLVVVASAAVCQPASTSAGPDTGSWGRIGLIGAELFGVDYSHSFVGFTIGFLGMTKVRGAFKSWKAAILYDEKDPTGSAVRAVFDAASIDTGNEMRDKDLQGESFFDVRKYPRLVFDIGRIERTGANHYLVHGTLEIRGVRREIAIPMVQTVSRMADSGWGNIRVGANGSVHLRRTDFGISGGDFWGKKALSDDVDVDLEILGTRNNWDKAMFDASSKGPSIGETLATTIQGAGIAAAVAQYRELKEKKPDNFNFDPDELRVLASRLLQHHRPAEALAILQLAIEAAPKDDSLYARLGETWATLGNREKALDFYRKAQQLSDSPEAVLMIRRLEETHTAVKK
jgi:polyisoprenoid-binding protein YceI